MQQRTKVITFRVLLIIVAVLFVGGFVYQKVIDKKAADNPTLEQQDEKVQNYFSNSGAEDRENANSSEDNGKVSSPSKKEKSSDSLAAFYSDDEIQTTKRTAEDFIKVIYPVNGDDPMGNFKKTENFTTKTLYSMINSGEADFVRPTSDFYYRELKSIQVEEPKSISDQFITWRVKATGEIKNKNGKKTDDDTTVYLLRFDKEADKYKVAEYIIDPDKE